MMVKAVKIRVSYYLLYTNLYAGHYLYPKRGVAR